MNLLPVQPACAAEVGSWCAKFFRWTHSDFLAASADLIVSKSLSIALIILFALLSRWLLNRAIHKLIEGATNGRMPGALRRRTPPRLRIGANPLLTERRAQRARTIGSVLRSITSVTVLLIAAVMILAEFGVALGPILASAGIVGVAIGFGAQNLVRDFLSGMFMLLEDQYGVGDVVDLGGAVGTVETVGLRITTVRDVKGTLWYVRNGEILRVGNMSQGHAVAVVDVAVGHPVDTTRAGELVTRAAIERLERADLAADVIDPPQLLGVDKVTAEGIVLRLTVRVAPGRQFAVQRALNAAITDAFDEAGLPRPGAPAAAPATAELPAPVLVSAAGPRSDDAEQRG